MWFRFADLSRGRGEDVRGRELGALVVYLSVEPEKVIYAHATVEGQRLYRCSLLSLCARMSNGRVSRQADVNGRLEKYTRGQRAHVLVRWSVLIADPSALGYARILC